MADAGNKNFDTGMEILLVAMHLPFIAGLWLITGLVYLVGALANLAYGLWLKLPKGDRDDRGLHR